MNRDKSESEVEHTLFIVERDDLDDAVPYQVMKAEHPPDSEQAKVLEGVMCQLVEQAEAETGERHRLVTEADTPEVTQAHYEMHEERIEGETLVTDGGVDQSEAEIEQTKEEYSDVLEFTTAETTEMNLDTDHVKAKVEADLGMKILQDGRFMGLSVSTLTGKNPRVSTFLGLTPSQAREIAAALNEAADNAEAVGEKSETPDDSETVFGRIKEAIQ